MPEASETVGTVFTVVKLCAILGYLRVFNFDSCAGFGMLWCLASFSEMQI